MDVTSITRLAAGGVWVNARIKDTNGRYELETGFSRDLIAEIKSMQDQKWHGYEKTNPRKIWSVKATGRNRFQLLFLAGQDVYAPWTYDLEKLVASATFNRPDVLAKHQKEMVAAGQVVPSVLFAAEMGTGKSLAAIEIMEHHYAKRRDKVIYVGPVSGVRAFKRELQKWSAAFRDDCLCFTYNAFVEYSKSLLAYKDTARYIIFDESSKLKTFTTARTIAAFNAAELIRTVKEGPTSILLLSGTPSPHTPADWWSQCEVAAPGFLKEGDVGKFTRRLSVQKKIEDGSVVYPKLITWLDSELKCAVCGQTKEHVAHTVMAGGVSADPFGGVRVAVPQIVGCSKIVPDPSPVYHDFVPSKNEVAYLGERMRGLVLVYKKKDCTDLPEKRYEKIFIKATPEILQAAAMIRKTVASAVERINLLRQLSDGFRYRGVHSETETCICEACGGTGVGMAGTPEEGEPCPVCEGTGLTARIIRETARFSTPKDAQLVEDLEEVEEHGRVCIWSGFQATVEHNRATCTSNDWYVLQIDGRGYKGFAPDGSSIDADELLSAMDLSHKNYVALKETYPRVAVCANPGSGGSALTFTAANLSIYYSNSYDGEARMQSEDRIHRMGMDTNRGATIRDYFLLPSDKLVFENITLKKKLQDLTLGDIESAYSDVW